MPDVLLIEESSSTRIIGQREYSSTALNSSSILIVFLSIFCSGSSRGSRCFYFFNPTFFKILEKGPSSSGSTGMYRQMTARIEPVKAIHTTLTAEGTLAA